MAASLTIPNRNLTWLITGCSSGFGLSLTRDVQAGGHKVIATSRNPTPDQVSEIEAKGDPWLKVDITDKNNSHLVEEIEKSGVAIDVLVNNTGYCIFSPVESTTKDELRAQMERVYFGPLRLIQPVLPHMRKRKLGVIANFSSGGGIGWNGYPTMGLYAGGKALSKILAKEVALFNIRILTVILGTFNINMGSNAKFSQNSSPEDYKGTFTEKMLETVSSRKIPAIGDKYKAMKAVYEVITGEGAGAGHEAETFLPMGSDMTVRVKGLQDALAHSLEVFGDIANSVTVGK